MRQLVWLMEVTVPMTMNMMKRSLPAVGLAVAFVVALFGLQHVNYLLFHSISEFIMAAIASNIFLIAWNTRDYCTEGWFQFLGAVFIWIAAISIIHALTFEGMGGLNLPVNISIQIKLLSRYIEAAAFAALPFTFGRKVDMPVWISAIGAVVGLGSISVFVWHNFPVCYIDGVGQTAFKINSEYAASLILLASALAVVRKSKQMDGQVLFWMGMGLTCTVLSSISLTQYTDVSENANVFGHILRLLAYMSLYKAVIETSLRRPFTVLFRDLRENEAARRRSDAAFRQIVETTQEGVWVLDNDSWTTYVNPQMAAMLDYEVEEMLGTHIVSFMFESDSSAAELHEERRRQGLAERYDIRYKRKDGGELWATVASNPLYDEYERPTGSFRVVTDITLRKRAEEELRSLSASKDHFISVASHELKTPLTVMLANLQLLKARYDSLSDQQKGNTLDTLIVQGRKLNRLVNDLLDMSRVANGQLTLSFRPTNLTDLVAAMVADGQAAYRSHTIEFQGEADLVSAVDADRIEQVVSNLISNAVRYSPSGSDVMVTLVSHGTYARINVKDQGCGMDRDEINRIFDRYYRSISAKEGVKSGMGLGLYVTKEIVERHSGKISVESKVGVGSTFTVHLPLVQASYQEDAKASGE